MRSLGVANGVISIGYNGAIRCMRTQHTVAGLNSWTLTCPHRKNNQPILHHATQPSRRDSTLQVMTLSATINMYPLICSQSCTGCPQQQFHTCPIVQYRTCIHELVLHNKGIALTWFPQHFHASMPPFGANTDAGNAAPPLQGAQQCPSNKISHAYVSWLFGQATSRADADKARHRGVGTNQFCCQRKNPPASWPAGIHKHNPHPQRMHTLHYAERRRRPIKDRTGGFAICPLVQQCNYPPAAV